MWEEVHGSNTYHTNIESLPEYTHFHVSLSLDSLLKVISPRVQLEYLNVIEALSGRIEPLVLAFHVPSLQTRAYLSQYNVYREG